MDPYFNREEVSNSDLTWLKKYWMPENQRHDIEKAYAFGTLLDAVITEPHRVDYFGRKVDDATYSKEDFEKVTLMRKAFFTDELCSKLAAQSSMQTVMSRHMAIDYCGFKFTLNVRCKWDLWMQILGWGADIKSTTATTQKQFVEACKHFDYDRQRAWYMDIAGSDKDMLIGISKANGKVFKLPINRGDEFYNAGKEKYSELAFKWWYLFA